PTQIFFHRKPNNSKSNLRASTHAAPAHRRHPRFPPLPHHNPAAMICRQCLRRATTAVARQPFLSRPLSTLPALRSAAAPAPATLSTPTTAAGEAAPATDSAAAVEPKSSCPAGTVLTGLNF